MTPQKILAAKSHRKSSDGDFLQSHSSAVAESQGCISPGLCKNCHLHEALVFTSLETAVSLICFNVH